MRPRDKRSADFRAVPTRYDTEPERLFCFDVTRRKILHELHEVCFQESARSCIERWVKFSGCSANNRSFSFRWKAGQSPQVRLQPDLNDGCRPEPAPRRINSRRSAPWPLLPATKLREPTEAGFRVSPADRAGPLRYSRRPARIRRMSVAFCSAIARCLSRSSCLSLTRRARVNALGIG